MKLPAAKILLLPAAGLAVVLAAAGTAYFMDTGQDENVRQMREPAVHLVRQNHEPQAPVPAKAQSSLLLRPLRDPFRLPPVLKAPSAAPVQAASARLPVLRGTVISEGRRFAIIEYGGSSSICRSGGRAGSYTVSAVTPGDVLLTSPAGPIKLTLEKNIQP